MLLKRVLLERIKAGEIDLVFRRWNKPTVRAGGTLKTKVGVLAIRSIDNVDPEQVTDKDVQRAGFIDVAEFRHWLETMKPGHLFQRIEVAFLGAS